MRTQRHSSASIVDDDDDDDHHHHQSILDAGHDPLCPDLVLEMKLFFVAELHRLIAPELICLASNVCTLGDIIDVPTAAPRYHF